MSNQLTEAQRYTIYIGLKRKWNKSRIADEIGVSKSTVCREVRRNSKPDGSYVWKYAQAKCDERRHGFTGNHRKPAELWWRIDCMIEADWSPGQIAGVLRKEGISICKQTIYNHVHADKTGKLGRHMPHELKYNRRTRLHRLTKATNITNRTSIHERLAEADGKGRGQAAVPIQEARQDHHDRQRVRIRCTHGNNQGTGPQGRRQRRCLLCRLILRMEERSNRERQQAYQKIHT